MRALEHLAKLPAVVRLSALRRLGRGLQDWVDVGGDLGLRQPAKVDELVALSWSL